MRPISVNEETEVRHVDEHARDSTFHLLSGSDKLPPDFLQSWRFYGLFIAKDNLRAKSLRAFKESHPEIKSVRFSLSGCREQDWMRDVPLYAMANMGLWG